MTERVKKERKGSMSQSYLTYSLVDNMEFESKKKERVVEIKFKRAVIIFNLAWNQEKERTLKF